MTSIEVVRRMPPRRRLERMRRALGPIEPIGMGLGVGVNDGGAPAQFSPISLAPALWLRADSLSAGPVSSWADLSGNSRNYTQGTGVNQPGFSSTGGPNSLPCVTFSGSQWLSFTGSFAVRRNWTAFITHKTTVTTTIQRSAVFGTSHGFQFSGTISHRELVLPGIADLTTGVVTTSWEVWTIQDNGTNQFFRLNGTAQTLSSNSSTPAIPNTDNGIGATGAAGANPLTGSVQEVIYYPTFLALSDVQNVEGYIRARTAIW